MTHFVRHDGVRMKVLRECAIDDEPGYELQPPRRPGARPPAPLFARASECEPWHSGARTRRLRDGHHVLEHCSDGTMRVRRARSPRRYPITLAQVYEYAVRLATFGKRLPKAFRARGRR